MKDAIAIVGMACRVPGARGPDEFWRLMIADSDPITRIGPDRWQGQLADVDLFDAGFFGISPREARTMDPQQRMLLEVTHEALEDAGIRPGALAGSDTGVFIGQVNSDYAQMQRDAGIEADIRMLTGAMSRGVTSGRVSFAFDLHGPSLTVDTTCSSSLVAVHLAVRSLRSGECGVAVAGGVNLVLLPEIADLFAGAGTIAGDGRCKFGDARADGFVRSEAVAAVVLKPLCDARNDGDRVHGVLLGSAIGNDGRGNGVLVAPSVDGQERLLRAAYRDAGVDPCDVVYVEAHGTGTQVGDPVELAALARVMLPGRPADRPCLVGSAKASIGHTESTAGLVGLIRATLCAQHAVVPPYTRLGELNPAVSWDGLALPRQATPMPECERGAPIGVSSFGISGTYAHVVLRVPDRAADLRPAPVEHVGEPVLLTASARSATALDALARAYRDHLAPSGPGRDFPLTDLGRAAATRRDHHEFRLAILAASHDELLAGLDDAVAGRSGPAVVRGAQPATDRPRVAFVFAGQGAQWAGMGRELLATEPAFASALLRCDEAVRAETGNSVLEYLTVVPVAGSGDISCVQPALWAVQVALASLWRSWGVHPDVVIGHSMGEVAAATVCGALSLHDAAAVICRRSALLRRMVGRGAMVLTELSPADAESTVARAGSAVTLAASNGPRSTMLAGDPAALDRIVARLRDDGVFCRRLDAGIASHNPQMLELAGELRSSLSTITPRPGEITLCSTVEGEVVDGGLLDPGYWVANLCDPVRFLEAVRRQPDGTVFLEVGPHPVLTGAVHDTITQDRSGGAAVGPLRRGRSERAGMRAGFAELYVRGIAADAAAIAPPGPSRFVDLPFYPWQHDSHWLAELDPPARLGPGPAVPAPRALPAPPARPAALVAARRQAGTPPEPGTTVRLVREHAARVVWLAPDQLPLDRPLNRLGLDSLMAAELRASIEECTGVRLSIGLMLGGACVTSLAEAVRSGLGEQARVAAAV